MKRRNEVSVENLEDYVITKKYIKKYRKDFNNYESNIKDRNAIVSVGSIFASTNSNEANKITHIFLNTLKPEHANATDQAQSGRCWMFAGLNIFRHIVSESLDLKNFEFSATYLYFWDKLERVNSYMQEIIEMDYDPNDRHMFHITAGLISDGGYWNTFVNLVEKYGLIPKSAMPETFQSTYSEELNDTIKERVIANIVYMKNKKLSYEKKIQIKKDILQQVYNILVKYLGEPPIEFEWSFTTTDYKSMLIKKLNPKKFKNMILKDIKLSDFVCLSNYPHHAYYKKYRLRSSNNIFEGKYNDMLNLPIKELRKYTVKSILGGSPVWFGMDVRKGYHPFMSALNDRLVDTSLVFGSYPVFTKRDRLIYGDTSACHAMTIIGVNLEAGEPTSYQVENSWGYFDNDVPGQDGFMTMDTSWFDEHVFDVVIHKMFLTEQILELYSHKPIIVEQWDPIETSFHKVDIHPVYKYKGINANLIEKKR